MILKNKKEVKQMKHRIQKPIKQSLRSECLDIKTDEQIVDLYFKHINLKNCGNHFERQFFQSMQDLSFRYEKLRVSFKQRKVMLKHLKKVIR